MCKVQQQQQTFFRQSNEQVDWFLLLYLLMRICYLPIHIYILLMPSHPQRSYQGGTKGNKSDIFVEEYVIHTEDTRHVGLYQFMFEEEWQKEEEKEEPRRSWMILEDSGAEFLIAHEAWKALFWTIHGLKAGVLDTLEPQHWDGNLIIHWRHLSAGHCCVQLQLRLMHLKQLVSNWILTSCQAHTVTSGWSNGVVINNTHFTSLHWDQLRSRSRPRRLSFSWWECYGLCLRHIPTSLPTLFFILFFCLFLSLWSFQVYFIP